MPGWKHSFERLSKHKYVAYIIHPKKVPYITGHSTLGILQILGGRTRGIRSFLL